MTRILELATAIVNGDDDMPLQQADKDWIEARLDAHTDFVAQVVRDQITALLTTKLGSSGPNVQVALQSGYQYSRHAAETSDAILAAVAPDVAASTVTVDERLERDADLTE